MRVLVKTCFYHGISEGSKLCYIRANVLSSFELNEKDHKTWVLLEKEAGSICSAGCTCMADIGQCRNRVAASLLKIEDVIKLEYNSSTCTLMPCASAHSKNNKAALPLPIFPFCSISSSCFCLSFDVR